MAIGVLDLLKLHLLTSAIDAGTEAVANVGGTTGATPQDPSKHASSESLTPSLLEQILSKRDAGNEFSQKLAANREMAETLGDPELVTSDNTLKAMYQNYVGTPAPAGITRAQKMLAINNAIHASRAPPPPPPPPTPPPPPPVTGTVPPMAPHTSLQHVSSAANKAALLEMLGKVAGGAVGILGSAGGVGPQDIWGPSPMKAGEFIGDITTGMASHHKQGIARKSMDRERAVLERNIQTIEASQLPDHDKMEYIRSLRKAYGEEVERIQRTLGLIRPSDSYLKNIQPHARTVVMALRDKDVELSDEDYKLFSRADPEEMAQTILRMGHPFTGLEMEFLYNVAKENSGKDYDYDIENVGIWSPKTLDGYARYIKNSVYTYKPEARLVDPSIDPTETHIGPMAQEIEKVNPAAIVETPEGIKEVDTGRLALMNAGAIGDLVRQNAMQGKAIERLAQMLMSRKEAVV